jgi:hypothetical protein
VPKNKTALLLSGLVSIITFIVCLFTIIPNYSSEPADPRMVENYEKEYSRLYSSHRLSENEIRNFLINSKFEELESYVYKYLSTNASDPVSEILLSWLVNDIDRKDLSLLTHLNRWVEQRPNFISYGFRGIFLTNYGYHLRGDKWISETPPENIKKMYDQHQLAWKDLQISRQKNRYFSPIYSSMIEILQANGEIQLAKKIHDEATKLIPKSSVIRKTYVQALRPKWGGSYEMMQKYIDSLNDVFNLNPLLYSIKGKVLAERGDAARSKANNRESIRYFTRAMAYGETVALLRERSRAYNCIYNYELARADIVKCKIKLPNSEYCTAQN